MIYAIAILLLGILIVLIAMYFNKGELQSNVKNRQALSNLYFKDNPSAFKYALEFTNYPLKPNHLYVGLILEINESVWPQIVTLKLAANNEELLVFGMTPRKDVHLAVGNLVFWGIDDVIEIPETGKSLPVGTILALLSPTFLVDKMTWEVRKDLT
ncbi:hypothetical protein J9826_003785 [Acinetobacter baumannii]|uniref:hypothetical protein n=1 Tax=Acinetobacter baumannii TaxID=470 RepID=UPI00051A1262|nr:hypothetical protein [Acinetobacter baumannii]EHU1845135.1 hypothetical protein [Acinetobacter baumannii]EHU2213860.1 hypothetical protein [Acinetobacter baumannii]EHU2217190.1 hypothetical protein [Acinetobacter baumannii]EKT9038168.1 hypothetical protein [Acinetobacter baumannii]EKU0658946.1 hypothetical protein [Acinetobacter baumannii]